MHTSQTFISENGFPNLSSELGKRSNELKNHVPARWTTHAIFSGVMFLGVRKATLALWLSGGNASINLSSHVVRKTPSRRQELFVSQTVFHIGWTAVGGQFWQCASGNNCFTILSSKSSLVPPHPFEKNGVPNLVRWRRVPYMWSST